MLVSPTLCRSLLGSRGISMAHYHSNRCARSIWTRSLLSSNSTRSTSANINPTTTTTTTTTVSTNNPVFSFQKTEKTQLDPCRRGYHSSSSLHQSSSSSFVSTFDTSLEFQNLQVQVAPRQLNDDGVTTKDGYAMIQLHRPKALNALNSELMKELIQVTGMLNQDPSVGCIIVMGSTPKAFCAGADITEMKDKSYEQVAIMDMFSDWQSIATTQTSSTPIFAAVSGFCLGGGCELAMMCDFILCDATAKFGQPEIKLGVIAGAGGTQRLTKLIGRSKSMYYNLTGDLMTAQEAYASGLVAQVCDSHEALVSKSIEVAQAIAQKGSLSAQICKEAVRAAEELSLQEGLRFERRMFHSLFATKDQKEGMAAFLEKRPPKFHE